MERIPIRKYGEKYEWNLRKAPFIITKSGKPAYIVMPYTNKLVEHLEREESGLLVKLKSILTKRIF